MIFDLFAAEVSTNIVVYNLFLLDDIKSLLLGMKYVFKHTYLQMFDLKLNKYE